eukprot:SAG25_NODE_9707_length_361_cov_0.812977_1_plen_50_part_01
MTHDYKIDEVIIACIGEQSITRQIGQTATDLDGDGARVAESGGPVRCSAH